MALEGSRLMTNIQQPANRYMLTNCIPNAPSFVVVIMTQSSLFYRSLQSRSQLAVANALVHEIFEERNEHMRLETTIVVPEPGIKSTHMHSKFVRQRCVSSYINLILE